MRLRQRLHLRSCHRASIINPGASSSLLESRHRLRTHRSRRSLSNGVLQTLRTSLQVLILPYVVNDIFWGISCQQTGRRRALVTIVNGSIERAKMRKICSSQRSSSHVQTYQHLPRMMPRQLSTTFGGSHVSSRSRRWCRWIQRRSNRRRNRSRYGERRRWGARPARYLPPNLVASAP